MSNDSKKKAKSLVSLPLSRVQSIMRSCPDITGVSSETVLLTAKAAELFIARLAEAALFESRTRHSIEYNDVARVIHEDSTFAFLKDVIPQKITVKKYKKILHDVEQQERELGRPVRYEPDIL